MHLGLCRVFALLTCLGFVQASLTAGIAWVWSMFLWTFEGLNEFPTFGMAAAKYGWETGLLLQGFELF